jgi:hypothetical protein
MLEVNTMQEKEEKTFDLRLKIMSALVILGMVWLAAAVSPWCLFNSGPFGWSTWTKVFPNLVCSLNLRDAGKNAFQEELNRRMRYFENLRQLDVSKNNLTEVPAEIVSLKKLQTLSLADNQLTSIPPEIDTMLSLQNLDLSSNKLRSLPKELGNIGLRTLNISDNEISTLPDSVANSPYLQSIDLSTNPITPQLHEQIAENITQNVTGSIGSSRSAVSTQVTQSSSHSSAASAVSGASTNQNISSQISAGGSATSTDVSSVAESSISSDDPYEDVEFVCDHNFTLNHFSFCIPPEWTVEQRGQFAAYLKEGDALKASVNCPLEQKNYINWNFHIRNRNFLKDGEKYGVDLWNGISLIPNTPGLLILFVHMHDFNSWYGNNYIDVMHSCQILSNDPDNQQNIFRIMYLSAE